jgi:hypothetical protein
MLCDEMKFALLDFLGYFKDSDCFRRDFRHAELIFDNEKSKIICGKELDHSKFDREAVWQLGAKPLHFIG